MKSLYTIESFHFFILLLLIKIQTPVIILKSFHKIGLLVVKFNIHSINLRFKTSLDGIFIYSFHS